MSPTEESSKDDGLPSLDLPPPPPDLPPPPPDSPPPELLPPSDEELEKDVLEANNNELSMLPVPNFD